MAISLARTLASIYQVAADLLIGLSGSKSRALGHLNFINWSH